MTQNDMEQLRWQQQHDGASEEAEQQLASSAYATSTLLDRHQIDDTCTQDNQMIDTCASNEHDFLAGAPAISIDTTTTTEEASAVSSAASQPSQPQQRNCLSRIPQRRNSVFVKAYLPNDEIRRLRVTEQETSMDDFIALLAESFDNSKTSAAENSPSPMQRRASHSAGSPISPLSMGENAAALATRTGAAAQAPLLAFHRRHSVSHFHDHVRLKFKEDSTGQWRPVNSEAQFQALIHHAIHARDDEHNGYLRFKVKTSAANHPHHHHRYHSYYEAEPSQQQQQQQSRRQSHGGGHVHVHHHRRHTSFLQPDHHYHLQQQQEEAKEENNDAAVAQMARRGSEEEEEEEQEQEEAPFAANFRFGEQQTSSSRIFSPVSEEEEQEPSQHDEAKNMLWEFPVPAVKKQRATASTIHRSRSSSSRLQHLAPPPILSSMMNSLKNNSLVPNSPRRHSIAAAAAAAAAAQQPANAAAAASASAGQFIIRRMSREFVPAEFVTFSNFKPMKGAPIITYEALKDYEQKRQWMRQQKKLQQQQQQLANNSNSNKLLQRQIERAHAALAAAEAAMNPVDINPPSQSSSSNSGP